MNTKTDMSNAMSNAVSDVPSRIEFEDQNPPHTAITATSKARADRLARMLLVVPIGVIGFGNPAPDQLTLCNGTKFADIRVGDNGVRLITSVRNRSNEERSVRDHDYYDDREAARALIRFFG